MGKLISVLFISIKCKSPVYNIKWIRKSTKPANFTVTASKWKDKGE